MSLFRVRCVDMDGAMMLSAEDVSGGTVLRVAPLDERWIESDLEVTVAICPVLCVRERSGWRRGAGTPCLYSWLGGTTSDKE